MNTIFPEHTPVLTGESASDSGWMQDNGADILDYLLQMEKKINALEDTVYSDRVRVVPVRVRRAGADYFRRNMVHRFVKETKDGCDVYSGCVLCSFGFVHHPWVCLKSQTEGILITGYSCDCRQFSQEEFCEHCAALIAGDHPGGVVTIQPGSARNGNGALEARQAGIKSVRVVEQSARDNGERVFRGKAVCSFNFVHWPELVLGADGAVKSYFCDCGETNGKMCSHSIALKQLTRECEVIDLAPDAPEEAVEEEDSFPAEPELPDFTLAAAAAAAEAVVAADAAEELTPEEEPEEGAAMTLCFGTDVQSDEPVLWLPNDTNQLTHINLGIIGTMGTGKTQFTKSIITQLHRQQRYNPGGEKLGILIFDYKGDYNEEKTDFVKAVNAKVLKLHRLPFNPFALSNFKRKPQLHAHTAMSFSDTLTQIYGLGQIQKTTLMQAILAAYEANGINGDPQSWSRPAPTFAQVYDQYSLIRGGRGDSLTAAMDTIAMFELFESDPLKTVSLYEMLRGTVVIDLSGYPNDLKNLAVAIILDLFYAQMLNSSHSHMVTMPDGVVYRQLKKVILVDEADNIMSSGLPVLRNIIKEGREFGTGIVLSTQYLDHFRGADEDYRKYMKTWVVHNVENLKRSDVEYVFQMPAHDPETEKIFDSIKRLEKHHSLVRIGTGAPVHIRDLPFFRIADDLQASYLPGPTQEPDGGTA